MARASSAGESLARTVVADREERGDDLGDASFAGGVEASGRLVQKHQRPASEECARERHPVRLAARQAPAALAERCIQGVGMPRQYIAQTRSVPENRYGAGRARPPRRL